MKKYDAIKLRPCPFCGNAISTGFESDLGNGRIRAEFTCKICNYSWYRYLERCESLVSAVEKLWDFIDEWNTRYNTDD
ncbi:MAG: hypothetical protein J6Q48_05905 [Bacteroidaceae bacterium]|nr:hypothetical protein [Bacteroidaceae bacterium]